MYAVGDIVTYECTSPTVHILTGTSTTECQANGEFSSLTAPTCDQGNHLLKVCVPGFGTTACQKWIKDLISHLTTEPNFRPALKHF